MDHTLVDPVTYSAIGGILVSVVTMILVHFKASEKFKTTVVAALSAVAGVVISLIDRGITSPKEILTSTVLVFVGAIGAYKLALKPTGAADAVASAVPGGIGTPVPPIAGAPMPGV